MGTPDRMSEFVESVSHIRWRTPEAVSPEAEGLIGEHIARMQEVVRVLQAKEGLTATAAYDRALSGGYQAPEYDELTRLLYERVDFRGAGVREHLVFVLASAYCWEQDPSLGAQANPWTPLVQLYRLGYTTSFEDDEEAQTVELLVGYRDGIARYRIV
jgi:hypothetical protein